MIRGGVKLKHNKRAFLAEIIFIVLNSILFRTCLHKFDQLDIGPVTSQLKMIVSFCFILFSIFGFVMIYFLFELSYKRQQSESKQQKLQSILDTMPLPVFIAKNGIELSFVNEACSTLFNQECQEKDTKPCARWKPGICNTLNCTIRRLQNDLSQNNYFDLDERSYQVSATPFKNQEQEGQAYVEVIQDITEVVKMQKVLKAKTTELEAITENIAGGILTTTLESGFPILSCNQGFCNLVNEKMEDVIGQKANYWIYPGDFEKAVNIINEQLNRGDFIEHELRLLANNERTIWILLRGKKTVINELKVCVWIISDITSMKEAEQRIQQSEELFRIAAENTEDIIIEYDILTKTMIHGQKATELYGVPLVMHNVPESLITSGTIDQKTVPQYLDLFKQMNNGVKKTKCEILAKTTNNQMIWNRLSFTTIFDGDGKPVRAIGIIQDINNEKVAKNQYEKEAKFRDITAQDLILSYEVDFINAIFITGHEEITKAYCGEIINDYRTVTKLLLDHFVYEEDYDRVADLTNYDLIKQRYYEDHAEKVSAQYRRITEDGTPKWVECTYYLYEDENMLKGLYFIKDIDSLKQREIDLRYKAERDLLTGSYNKVTTELEIQQFIRNHPGKQEMIVGAFMLIDLDNFKSINDTLGHAFGDAVLSEVARKIPTLFRAQDILGRIGGDEFVVFMQYPKTMEVVEQRAQEVTEMFRSAYTGSGNYYKVSCSIGISLYPQQGTYFEDLYRKADIAMYHAKASGKDTYEIFKEEMTFNTNVQYIDRQIDENYGKTFADNISEYILRILYESNEPKLAVRAILELVSKHYNHDRGYIFELSKDEKSWNNTYEWCSNGVVQKIDQHQNISVEAFGNYQDNFNEDGFYVTSDSDVGKGDFELSLLSESKSSIQCAIVNYGGLKGFIGFEDCTIQRVVTEEERHAIQLVALLVGTFLMNHDGIEGELIITEDIEQVMNTIENYIYIVDSQNYQLRFINKKTRDTAPGIQLGDVCYEVIREKNQPCDDCPKKGMDASNSDKFRCRVYNETFNKYTDTTISQVKWRDGSQCYLLNSFDTNEKDKK